MANAPDAMHLHPTPYPAPRLIKGDLLEALRTKWWIKSSLKYPALVQDLQCVCEPYMKDPLEKPEQGEACMASDEWIVSSDHRSCGNMHPWLTVC